MKQILLLISLLLSSHLFPLEEIQDFRKTKILSSAEQDSAKIRLNNGLEAFIISDPTVTKAAASLTVLTGSWSDPEEYPGMAHFLEHMLFLGTEEYPGESEYSLFINDHGGQTNAFTSDDVTSYILSIDSAYLDEGLNRFSSFFKNPLLNTDQATKELKAIDQEFAKNLNNDWRRQYDIHKSLLNPNHPSHRFAIGNSSTLKNVSQKELRNFYESHYSANLMRLIVIGKEPLNQLVAMVEEKFNPVPNRDLKRYIPNMPRSNREYQGKLVTFEPVQDMKQLTLMFEIPETFNDHDANSTELINFIITRKSSLLKSKNLVEDVSAYTTAHPNGSLELVLTFQLTDEGVKNWEKVLLRVSQELKTFSTYEVPEGIYYQLCTQAEINYTFKKREDALQAPFDKAGEFARESMETFPEKSYLYDETFDSKKVMEIGKYLTLDNAYIYLTAKNLPFSTNRQEKWDGTHFGVHPIKLNKTVKDLEEPLWTGWDPYKELKEFITDLNHKEKEDHFSQKGLLLPIPQPIIDDETAHIFFTQEHRYLEPMVSFSFFLRDKELNPNNPKSIVLADLFAITLNDALKDFHESASFEIHNENLGFNFEIIGSRAASFTLFDKMLKTIQEKPAQDFEALKSKLMKNYTSFDRATPEQQSNSYLKAYFYKNEHHPSERKEVLKKINENDFKEYTKKLFNEAFLEGVILGNLSSDEALKLGKAAREAFVKKPLKKPFAEHEFIDIKTPLHIQKKIDMIGNAALLQIEMPPPYSDKKRAIQLVLAKAVEQLFFSELRTKQQTGYVVKTNGYIMEKHLVTQFFVQSTSHLPNDLLARYELFIENFLQNLPAHLTEERFNDLKKASIPVIIPNKNIDDTSYILSRLMLEGNFLREDECIRAIQNLTYEECLEVIRETLHKDNPRRIAILLSGKPF